MINYQHRHEHWLSLTLFLVCFLRAKLFLSFQNYYCRVVFIFHFIWTIDWCCGLLLFISSIMLLTWTITIKLILILLNILITNQIKNVNTCAASTTNKQTVRNSFSHVDVDGKFPAAVWRPADWLQQLRRIRCK